jgi:hypothetical protein
MDDDRITRQDLIYAAHALRESASRAEEKAKSSTHSLSEVNIAVAKSQRALADKFERRANRPPTPPAASPARPTSPPKLVVVRPK